MTRIARLLVIGAGVALVGIGVSGRQSTALATPAHVLKAKFVPCTGVCGTCPTGHYADGSPLPGSTKDASEGDMWHAFPACSGSTNCDGHQCAESSPAPSPEAVANAIMNRDEDALRRLVAEFPTKVTYFATRRAIQVVGCNGQIVAHIPVAEEIAAEAGLQ